MYGCNWCFSFFIYQIRFRFPRLFMAHYFLVSLDKQLFCQKPTRAPITIHFDGTCCYPANTFPRFLNFLIITREFGFWCYWYWCPSYIICHHQYHPITPPQIFQIILMAMSGVRTNNPSSAQLFFVHISISMSSWVPRGEIREQNEIIVMHTLGQLTYVLFGYTPK